MCRTSFGKKEKHIKSQERITNKQETINFIISQQITHCSITHRHRQLRKMKVMKVCPETSQTIIEHMKSAVHLDREHVWSAAVGWRKHFSQDKSNWDPSNQQDKSLKNYGICNHKNLDKWFTKFQKLMDSSNVILMVFGKTTTYQFGSQSVPLKRHLMFGTPGQ